MKYSILINQAGIVDSGLHKSTVMTDWALLEYIADWQIHGRAHRLDDHVWLNYAHLMDEMPLLGINTKGGVSNRVKKLVLLGLLSVVHDNDGRVFVKLTDFYLSVVSFRSPVGGSSSLKPKVSAPAPVQEQAVHIHEHPVHENEHQFISVNTPVHIHEHPVHIHEHPVHENEHSIYNQLSTNQISNNQNINNSVELPQKDFAVSDVFGHWRTTMGHEKSVLDKKRRSAIKNALAWGYSLDVLKQAISGCANTPHNMGANDRNQRYDGIELILRSADQIDRFVRNYHHPPVILNGQQRLELQNTQVLSDWVPPELRYANQ